MVLFAFFIRTSERELVLLYDSLTSKYNPVLTVELQRMRTTYYKKFSPLLLFISLALFLGGRRIRSCLAFSSQHPHNKNANRQPTSQHYYHYLTSSTTRVVSQPPLSRRTMLLPLDMVVSKQQHVQEQYLDLDSGVTMQVMSMVPSATDREQQDTTTTKKKNESHKQQPPIIFLHGSFHGAWCWTEHFFEYFVQRGYSLVAPSWRGTGGTPAGEGIKKVQIGQHVADLDCLLHELSKDDGNGVLGGSTTTPPVLVAHSFGGLAIMKWLEEDPVQRASRISGICMMCSVPPSGNGKMTMRYLRRSLVDSYRITVGFAMKQCLKNADLCRRLFFGGPKTTMSDGSSTIQDYGVSDQDIERYQSYFTRDSEATIDLFDLATQLPSSTTDDQGRASFWKALPPCLVLGATDDFIVDREGVEETARYFHVNAPLLVDSPHDVMLGAKWQNAAQTLADWLEGEFKKS